MRRNIKYKALRLYEKIKIKGCIILHNVFHAEDNMLLFLMRQLKISVKNVGKNEIRRLLYLISYFYCDFCIIECNKDYKMLQEEYKNVLLLVLLL